MPTRLPHAGAWHGCRVDDVVGVSESIIMGIPMPVGTGLFKLRHSLGTGPGAASAGIAANAAIKAGGSAGMGRIGGATAAAAGSGKAGLWLPQRPAPLLLALKGSGVSSGLSSAPAAVQVAA